jgi:hypothetical protein
MGWIEEGCCGSLKLTMTSTLTDLPMAIFTSGSWMKLISHEEASSWTETGSKSLLGGIATACDG